VLPAHDAPCRRRLLAARLISSPSPGQSVSRFTASSNKETQIRTRTFCFPTVLVNRWDPPAPGIVARVISGNPNLASVDAKIISHCRPYGLVLCPDNGSRGEFSPAAPTRNPRQTNHSVSPHRQLVLRRTHCKSSHSCNHRFTKTLNCGRQIC
jgi:hypothetical protein